MAWAISATASAWAMPPKSATTAPLSSTAVAPGNSLPLVWTQRQSPRYAPAATAARATSTARTISGTSIFFRFVTLESSIVIIASLWDIPESTGLRP